MGMLDDIYHLLAEECSSDEYYSRRYKWYIANHQQHRKRSLLKAGKIPEIY
jgi:hypothetical protein